MSDGERYGVIVQARTSSTRLPGKVLMDIAGKPMLLRQLQRLHHGLNFSKLVVATSDDPSDDAVEKLCRENDFQCFRGPLNDVMQRFILCAQEYDIDYIIRVGGDDPLIDPECCNYLRKLHLEGSHYDFMYASNREGWPYGCAAELISRKALNVIHQKVDNPFYTEHTIPYFFDHPDEFRVLKVLSPEAIRRPDYYFTVDYPEDLALIRRIFTELLSEGEFFPLQKVIHFIDTNQKVRSVNNHLHEGFDR